MTTKCVGDIFVGNILFLMGCTSYIHIFIKGVAEHHQWEEGQQLVEVPYKSIIVTFKLLLKIFMCAFIK